MAMTAVFSVVRITVCGCFGRLFLAELEQRTLFKFPMFRIDSGNLKETAANCEATTGRLGESGTRTVYGLILARSARRARSISKSHDLLITCKE